ncbi:hypothetical protein MMC18_007214 [Xylographa bjoerkii]|nr:hypothetical protein [Xylographa bjoerkii]
MEADEEVKVLDLGVTIEKLSNEVLMLMFSYLPHNKDLVQIALVSTRFRDCVEPFLYRLINALIPCTRLDEKPHTWFRSQMADIHGRSLMATTQSLEKNSHLIRYVAAIDIATCYCGHSESLLACERLLNLVPNLKELSLRPSQEDLNISKLKSLEVLRIGHSVYVVIQWNSQISDWVDPMVFLARHFWMPSLRRLEIGAGFFSRYVGYHYFPKTRHRTSSITDLCINDNNYECYSSFIANFLPDICQTAKALQRIILETDEPGDHEPAGWLAKDEYLQIIERAIQPHYDTLTDLFLVGLFPCDGGDTESLDVVSFRHLKKLAIPLRYLALPGHYNEILTPSPRLPPSIEELQLQFDANADCEDTRQAMECFAESKQTVIPALSVVIEWVQIRKDSNFNGHGKGCFVCQRDRHRSIFKEVDIKYEMILQENFSGTPLGKTSASAFAAAPGENHTPGCCNGLKSCCK